MSLNILIAENRDIIRRGLYAMLVESGEIGTICEVTTAEDLQFHLRSKQFDFVIIHQSLIVDFTILPEGQFIVLVTELEIDAFQAVYAHGACAYLLETTSSELLHAALSLPKDAFLIEPTMARSIIKSLSSDSRFSVKDELLTPREREITNLLRNGIDRRTIAEHLNISASTLKTHVKNIMRKKEQEVG